MIDYCFIVKDITTLTVRLETTTMEQYKFVADETDDVFQEKSIYPPTPNTISVGESPDLFPEHSQMSGEASIYPPTPNTISVGESPDLFPEHTQMSVESQETVDLCTATDPLEGSSTQYVCVAAQKQPKEEERRKPLKLSSEHDIITDEEDSDATPDLDAYSLLSNFKRDDSDTSKEQGVVAKSFVELNEIVENAELEDEGHCLLENKDSDESDSSGISESSDIEGFKCNYDNCFISHTTRIRQHATHPEHHETTTLDQFMDRTITMKGGELIGLMSFHAHRLRDCRRKLIQDYKIPAYIVQRWMDLL